MLSVEESGQSTIDQPETAPAAGLFASSPHSESTEQFADAVSSPPGSRSSSASAATNSTFQTAASLPTDGSPRRNSSGDASNSGDGNKDGGQLKGEEEGRRSMQRRKRGAGLASVLGSPSPPRQSRFARFVNSAAAATGLNRIDAGPAEPAGHAQPADSSPAGDGKTKSQTVPGDEQSQSPGRKASHQNTASNQAADGMTSFTSFFSIFTPKV